MLPVALGRLTGKILLVQIFFVWKHLNKKRNK